MQSWFLGRTVTHVGFTYENLSIGFNDGTGVTIYNPCSVTNGFRPDRYIVTKIVTERWSSDQLQLGLDNGEYIAVDFTDQAWQGPEALVFADEGGVIMVVNEPPTEMVTFQEEER